jgi:hypothetical protein
MARPTRDEVRDGIRTIISNYLAGFDGKQIGSGTTFKELGLEGFDMPYVSSELAKMFGVPESSGWTTVGEAEDYILANI